MSINVYETKHDLEKKCSVTVEHEKFVTGNFRKFWAQAPEGAQEYTLLQEYYHCGTPAGRV